MSNAALAFLHNDTPSKDDRRILNFQHEGYMIIVGKNSFSNERIISDHPHRECLWLHAMAARGSHVILCIHERPEPEESIIQYAAKLALKHSHSEVHTVSMALLRDMIKPERSAVGVWKPTRAVSIEVDE